MISFVVHGKPEPAGSKRAVPLGRGGRYGVIDANKNATPWKGEVAAAAARAMETAAHPLLTGPLQVEFTFWLTRPAGHFGTGKNAGTLKASAPRHPIVKPDVLKLARAIEDACTKIVWRDDAQIVDERLLKGYTSGGSYTSIVVKEVA